MFAFKSRLSHLLSRNLAVVKTPPLKKALSPPALSTRSFSNSIFRMSGLSVQLTTPNGKKYEQPTGLFINNEFVKSVSGEKITSINPTWVPTNQRTRIYLSIRSRFNH